MGLVKDVQAILSQDTEVARILDLGPFEGFAEMVGQLFARITGSETVGAVAHGAYDANPDLCEMTLCDIRETARRNFEPGGAAATFLFARGCHAIMAHRVAHDVWTKGLTMRAMAFKSACDRVLGTDIHPAASIGAGLWLDHGLGCVIGETAVIGDNVSIWHNVTLGSTLADSGATRHPRIYSGVVIGTGATILGNITIGAGANIAAGAVVLRDVPADTLIAGVKAETRGKAQISFAPKEPRP